MDDLAEGEVVLVNELSRLGRSLADTLAAIEGVKERGAAFRSIIDGVGGHWARASRRSASKRLGAVAQFERAPVAERSRLGVARAKAEGRTLGRRHALSPQQWLLCAAAWPMVSRCGLWSH